MALASSPRGIARRFWEERKIGVDFPFFVGWGADLNSLQYWEGNFIFFSKFSLKESGLFNCWQGSFLCWPQSSVVGSVKFLGWQRISSWAKVKLTLVFTSSFEPQSSWGMASKQLRYAYTAYAKTEVSVHTLPSEQQDCWKTKLLYL